jgi:hypothetical protein
MKRFVFWTGIYDIVGGLYFLSPAIVELLGIRVPEARFWSWMVGVLIIYLGVVLVLSSFDLAARGALVYWEGVLRMFGFLLFSIGFFTDVGKVLGWFAAGDLLIGIVYLVGLPQVLKASPIDLLFDRVDAAQCPSPYRRARASTRARPDVAPT